MLVRMWKIVNTHLLAGIQTGTATIEINVWKLLRKAGFDHTQDPAVLFLACTQRMLHPTTRTLAQPC